MRKILPVLVLLMICTSLFSQQIREFAVDTVEYTDQLRQFMSGTKEEGKQITNRFISMWKSDSITYPDKMKMMEVSNLLLVRRARPEPDFTGYLTVFMMAMSGAYPDFGLDKWLEAFNSLAANREVPFRDTQRFLALSVDLLKNRNLYNLAGNNWKSTGGEFRFTHKDLRPFVIFTSTDLHCYSNKDTLSIINTSGTYDLLTLEWKGKGGRIDWGRAGLDPAEVYADLSTYHIEMNRAQYEADSVQFIYKKYFDYPLEGKLEDKAMPISEPDKALYPKFYSYQGKYILPDLFKGIEYTGGLSMQGAKLVGTGSEGNPARLDIFEKDTLRMELFTNSVVIREKSMNSPSVRVSIYLENDSIYHPDLQFLYFEDRDEIRLSLGDRYTSGVPCSDSYHKIDMNFEELDWERGSGIIHLRPSIGRAIGQASFESNNLFNYQVFDELQGRDFVNPLVSLWQFSRRINNIRKFPVTVYAEDMGMVPYQVRHQLMKLSRLGFVFFDDQTDMVTLNDKLFYYLDASVGKTDYDVIFLMSRVNTPEDNASLNLGTKDLTIYGVPNIFLSDSQNVVLIPDEHKIIMKRNRNFQFGGEVKAGLTSFFGSNFFFKYDSFKINLQDIDSLKLQVLERDPVTGTAKTADIKNLIEDLTGELLIDDPANKSGLQNYARYPIFTSRENSYVYFDDPSIQHGVYHRKDVYFEVYNFEVDSLDNFDRHGLNLKGKFESGGMLPPLEQQLTLRNDNSFGFTYTTPESGIQVYNAQGTFYHDLEMSSSGLHGAGQLDYLTSTTYSDDFLMHPDSVTALGREFRIAQQTSGTPFPKVESRNDRIRWLTKDEQFYAYRQDIAFTMYNDTVLFNGDLLLEPKGLSGGGTVDLISASVGSKKFNFLSKNILADSSGFRLNALDSDQPAISAENIRSDINFNANTGEFYANEDYTRVDFPAVRYVSDLDFFKWDIKDEKIQMGLNKTPDQAGQFGEDSLTGPRYISVKPNQDSLSFVAPLALYDYRNSMLDARNVPYIRVADAKIFPDKGNVIVRKNAEMGTLSNAGIIADNIHQFYSLYGASVTIYGRKDYSASAYYDYTDISGRPQQIFFNRLVVDSSLQTTASADISLPDSFRLSPYFEYQGKVRLEARKPNLFFDGAARLTHDCSLGRSWLKFKSAINPDSVMIPVAEAPLDINLNPAYFGTFITRDSTHIYTAFSSGRKDFFDALVTSASGYLRFDPYTERYEVGSAEKLADKNKPGNYVALDVASCQAFSEGDINLQVDFGQLKMTTVGEAVENISADTFSTRLLMALDFYFSPEALAEFGRELDSITSMATYDMRDPFYVSSLKQLIGADAVNRMEADISLYGEYRNIPEKFNKNLILSDVKLQWNQLTRTYRYHGNVAIVRVGNRLINKKAEAYIELTKRSSGDLLDIYLVLSDKNWYYFGYNPGSLQTVSSNRIYNNIVFELKPGDRKVKTRLGQTGFIYSLAADRRAQLFLRRYVSSEENGGDLSDTQ